MSDKRFKGWYYKQRSGDYMLAFIPSVASDGAFVQVIDSSGTKSFPMPYLFAAGDTVYTGNCVFSPQGVRVSLPGISTSWDPLPASPCNVATAWSAWTTR